MLFLICVFLSLVLFIINVVVYAISRAGGGVNQTVVIVIVSVVGAIIGVPMVVFMVFHICLAVRGRTTREVLKKI